MKRFVTASLLVVTLLIAAPALAWQFVIPTNGPCQTIHLYITSATPVSGGYVLAGFDSCTHLAFAGLIQLDGALDIVNTSEPSGGTKYLMELDAATLSGFYIDSLDNTGSVSLVP